MPSQSASGLSLEGQGVTNYKNLYKLIKYNLLLQMDWFSLKISAFLAASNLDAS